MGLLDSEQMVGPVDCTRSLLEKEAREGEWEGGKGWSKRWMIDMDVLEVAPFLVMISVVRLRRSRGKGD